MINLLKDLERVKAELGCRSVRVSLGEAEYLKFTLEWEDGVKYRLGFSLDLITNIAAPETLWEKIIIDVKRPTDDKTPNRPLTLDLTR